MASAVKPLIRLSLLAAASAMASGTAALAQNSVPAQPLPGLDSFSLPSNRPPPRVAPSPEPTTNPRPVETETVAPPVVAPTARATAAPRATPTPARPAPAARPTPAAERTPAPRPTASATPVAPPVAVPVVAPSSVATDAPTPAPTAEPSAAPTTPAAPVASGVSWIWPVVGGLALIIALGLVLWWRRRASQESVAYDDVPLAEDVAPAAEPAVAAPVAPAAPNVAPPVPEPVPAVVEPVAAARPMITFELTPKRAGTNLLSASVEYQIVLRNTGDAAATGVRLDIRLLSAGAQQDATIAALFAAPIDRPITAPFDLPAGVAVELSGMALHPKASLEVIEMGGKAMFVPVLTVVADYDWADGSGRTARSYVIGIDRGAGGKLAPFRIDSGARMVDTVGAIEYPVSATR